MLLSSVFPIPNSIALGTVGFLLVASIVLSLIFPKKNGEDGSKTPTQPSGEA
jgi:hypothetical protein